MGPAHAAYHVERHLPYLVLGFPCSSPASGLLLRRLPPFPPFPPFPLSLTLPPFPAVPAVSSLTPDSCFVYTFSHGLSLPFEHCYWLTTPSHACHVTACPQPPFLNLSLVSACTSLLNLLLKRPLTITFGISFPGSYMSPRLYHPATCTGCHLPPSAHRAQCMPRHCLPTTALPQPISYQRLYVPLLNTLLKQPLTIIFGISFPGSYVSPRPCHPATCTGRHPPPSAHQVQCMPRHRRVNHVIHYIAACRLIPTICPALQIARFSEQHPISFVSSSVSPALTHVLSHTRPSSCSTYHQQHRTFCSANSFLLATDFYALLVTAYVLRPFVLLWTTFFVLFHPLVRLTIIQHYQNKNNLYVSTHNITIFITYYFLPNITSWVFV